MTSLTALTHLSSAAPQSSGASASSAPARRTPELSITAEPTAEQKKAARDFEAIFIRQLLSSLEKSSGLTGGESSGGAVFRSMMVGALADTAAEGGGIGLSDLILKAMLPPAAVAESGVTPAQAGLSQREPSSQMGALHGGVQIGSSRLGVAGRVLTEARPVTISSGRPNLAELPRSDEDAR